MDFSLLFQMKIMAESSKLTIVVIKYKYVLVDVLWEANTKRGVDVKEMYLRKMPIREKGRAPMKTGPENAVQA